MTIADPARLFDCDLFLFTASRGVPPVGTQIADVRMAQYQSNAALLKPYARAARESAMSIRPFHEARSLVSAASGVRSAR